MRTYVKVLLLALSVLLPIIIVVFTDSFWFLLLILPQLFLWNKYGRFNVIFTPSQTCPTCQYTLVIQERKDETVKYYLRCDECNREILVYSIPPNYSMD